jgi:cation diffusion facilitator family transporter
MTDRQRGYHIATKATWVGLAVNASLGTFKLVAGLVGNSWAVVADGIHTISDIASSLGAMIGLMIARRAPDETHPYGHGKAEVLAARFVALVLLVIGGLILTEAGHRLFTPHATEKPGQIALWAALVSIIVKEGLYRYKAYFARRTGSAVLHAEAWHHRSDAVSSVPVLFGVAGAMFLGEKMRWLDPAAAALVGVVIIWISLRMFYATVGQLMDEAAPTEVTDGIRRIASSVPGVLGVEKIHCRKTGLHWLVDIHIEVEPKMPVDDAHRIAQDVTRDLVEKGDNILQALVHVEPFYPGDHAEKPSA